MIWYSRLRGIRKIEEKNKERKKETADTYVYIYHILYIIAETERKWVPTIKEVVTNKITTYLKFRHI